MNPKRQEPLTPPATTNSACPLHASGQGEPASDGARAPLPEIIEEPVVTAADFVRGFSECRDLANKVPVYVTHHGRPTHVLLSVDAFRSLRETSAHSGQKSTNERLYALADWVDQAVIICDQDMRVVFVNRVARAICRRVNGDMTGHSLAVALPEITGSLMEVHIRRTITGGEPSAADIPSPFADGAWLRLQSFPLGHSTVVMFRDITEDVQRHRMADAKAALIDAMTAQGDIGYVRLSPRGAIEKIGAAFSDIVCLPGERLTGILMADLIITGQRAAFRESLEQAMQGQGAQCINASFLNNRGEIVPTKISIVPLQGAYGMEGAVILTTLLDSPGTSALGAA